MNKRFKRYQKFLAVSLAALSCSIQTKGLNVSGLFGKIKTRFQTIKWPTWKKMKIGYKDIKDIKYIDALPILEENIAENKILEVLARIDIRGICPKDPEQQKEVLKDLALYSSAAEKLNYETKIPDILKSCENNLENFYKEIKDRYKKGTELSTDDRALFCHHLVYLKKQENDLQMDIERYGLLGQEVLWDALEEYAYNIGIEKNEKGLTQILDACDGDKELLSGVLRERYDKNRLDEYTKNLWELEMRYQSKNRPDSLTSEKEKLYAFALEVEKLQPSNGGLGRKEMKTFDDDYQKIGDEIEKTWMDYLRQPIMEGRMDYTKDLPRFLKAYFGKTYIPKTEDAKKVLDLSTIWKKLFKGRDKGKMIISTYVEGADPRAIRDAKFVIFNFPSAPSCLLKELKQSGDDTATMLIDAALKLPLEITHPQLKKEFNDTIDRLEPKKDASSVFASYCLDMINYFVDPRKPVQK